jgi:hypothetical protein
LQFGFGSRVGFAKLCFWCVFFFLAFGFIYQTFVWLCFTTTLCKQFAVFPFWVILDFCVVAGQVYVPRLFVFLFYLLYFPLLKKKRWSIHIKLTPNVCKDKEPKLLIFLIHMHFQSNGTYIHKIQPLAQITSHSFNTPPQKIIKEKHRLHLIHLINV